jgi:Uma2 family endonuclease
MSQETALTEMTTEELFALPDNEEADRELIDGQLWEEPVTKRTPDHGRIEAALSHVLNTWRDQQPKPRGQVYSGECAFRIRKKPDTTVGIDVAYIAADLAARTPRGATWIDGVPVLAAEVLSPSDTFSKVARKVRAYLQSGVSLVWVIDPFLNVVYAHRPEARPQLLTGEDELSAEPHLPGFRLPVATLFEEEP